MKHTVFLIITLAILSLSFIQDSLDKFLREIIRQEQLEPLQKPEGIAPAKVELGRLLFFDKLLSGTRDLSAGGIPQAIC